MMKLAIFFSCVFVFALPRVAAQPWSKPVAKWSDNDARRVLSASPWAKRTAVKLREAQPTGSAQSSPAKVIVRWESAVPVQMAQRKIGSEPNDIGAEGGYEVAVVGLFPEDSEAFSTAKATLQYCDRDLVVASEVKMLKDSEGRQVVVFQFPVVEEIRVPGDFRFPLGITLNPNEFRFIARIGPFEIRREFSLRDMTYAGRLAL